MDYREKLEEYVTGQLNSYMAYNVYRGGLENYDKEHIVSIGVSILETRFPEIGPGYSGGSFVCAVVQNDLMGAMSRADNVNIEFLKFYCQLMYNFAPYQVGYREPETA
jgi:hypothetical protein